MAGTAIGGLLGGLALGRQKTEERDQRTFENSLKRENLDLLASQEARLNRTALATEREKLMAELETSNPNTAPLILQRLSRFSANPDVPDDMKFDVGGIATRLGLSQSTKPAMQTAQTAMIPGLTGLTAGSVGMPTQAAPRPAQQPAGSSSSAFGASPPPATRSKSGGGQMIESPSVAASGGAGDGYWSPQAKIADIATQRILESLDRTEDAPMIPKRIMAHINERFPNYTAALNATPDKFSAAITEWTTQMMSDGWTMQELLDSGLQNIYSDYKRSYEARQAAALATGKGREMALKEAAALDGRYKDLREQLTIAMGGGEFKPGIGMVAGQLNGDAVKLFNQMFLLGEERVVAGMSGFAVANQLLLENSREGFDYSTWDGMTPAQIEKMNQLFPMGAPGIVMPKGGDLFVQKDGEWYAINEDGETDLTVEDTGNTAPTARIEKPKVETTGEQGKSPFQLDAEAVGGAVSDILVPQGTPGGDVRSRVDLASPGIASSLAGSVSRYFRAPDPSGAKK